LQPRAAWAPGSRATWRSRRAGRARTSSGTGWPVGLVGRRRRAHGADRAGRPGRAERLRRRNETSGRGAEVTGRPELAGPWIAVRRSGRRAEPACGRSEISRRRTEVSRWAELARRATVRSVGHGAGQGWFAESALCRRIAARRPVAVCRGWWARHVERRAGPGLLGDVVRRPAVRVGPVRFSWRRVVLSCRVGWAESLARVARPAHVGPCHVATGHDVTPPSCALIGSLRWLIASTPARPARRRCGRWRPG
jgi:hypothetical protein